MKTLNEARAEVVELATSKYLEGLNLMQSTLCLGWEAKVKKGAYGQNNHDAHKEANLAFGAHYGIHETIKLLEEPLKAQDDQIGEMVAALNEVLSETVNQTSYPDGPCLSKALRDEIRNLINKHLKV